MQNGTGLMVPVRWLEACLACIPKDRAARYYLNGVCVRVRKGRVEAVATDGHRLLLCSGEPQEDAGAWPEHGVVLAAEGLKQKLGFLKASGALVKVELETIASLDDDQEPLVRAKVSDLSETVIFKVQLCEGRFPDYERIVEGDHGAFDADLKEWEAVTFRSDHMRQVGDVAKLLSSREHGYSSNTTAHVSVFARNATGAAAFTFSNEPAAVMYLMPARTATPISGGAAKVLEPVMRGSLAALKAHETRNRRWAEEADDPEQRAVLLQRAEDFKARIDELRTRLKPVASLPKPKAPPRSEHVPLIEHQRDEGEGEATAAEPERRDRRPRKSKAAGDEQSPTAVDQQDGALRSAGQSSDGDPEHGVSQGPGQAA